MRAEPKIWLTPGIVLTALGIPTAAHAAGLNLIPDVVAVATNVVLFLLLIYPVNKLLVGPLLRVLDERAERTSGALAKAEALTGEARATRADLEERLRQARARAQARRNAILADGEVDERAVLEAARTEAVGNIETMRHSVHAELISARAGLETETRALAREVATRVLGRAL